MYINLKIKDVEEFPVHLLSWAWGLGEDYRDTRGARLVEHGVENALLLPLEFLKSFTVADQQFVAGQALSPTWGYPRLILKRNSTDTVVFEVENVGCSDWRVRVLDSGDSQAVEKALAELANARAYLGLGHQARAPITLRVSEV